MIPTSTLRRLRAAKSAIFAWRSLGAFDTEVCQCFRFMDNITRSINGVHNEYK
jgi:hypothetical protein